MCACKNGRLQKNVNFGLVLNVNLQRNLKANVLSNYNHNLS